MLDGCGPSIQIDTAKGEVMRVQPRTNDDVNEEWISDKTRYAVDGLKRQRLDVPLARGPDGTLAPVSWKDALSLAAEKMGSTPGTKMAALAGPLVEVEALVPLKDLMNSLGCTGTGSTVPQWRLNPLGAFPRASWGREGQGEGRIPGGREGGPGGDLTRTRHEGLVRPRRALDEPLAACRMPR